MYKHLSDAHKDEKRENIKFGMTVVKQHFSAFSRQIHESILIFRDKNVLNSKSMFNRCQVPRLSVMVGEQVATDLDQVKYDQVELDTELENIRNKHHLASAEVSKSKKQKRWHVSKRKKINVVVEAADEVSNSIGTEEDLSPNPTQSSEVVTIAASTKKHFPIFNSRAKPNFN